MEATTKEAIEVAGKDTGSMERQINKKIDKIIQLASKAGDQAPNGKSAKQLLRAVVYGEGKTGNTPKMDVTATDRAESCGKRSANGAKSAALSIGVTLACFCASDTAQTNNKGCYETGSEQNFVRQAAVAVNVWTEIKKRNVKQQQQTRKPQQQI
uniref:Variant surface glycoprotein n=1 Tax=Trypanosoma brucei TaxID=5691 RepID=A0A1V0FYP2_9TRYP|nr:variant surface glycoprotein [Trypanosoma brucei]